ncbi:type II secretion system minor pseudopilin GspH [Marinobacter caseinilyticus]|uniref:type II secretion system minor pseudopilin GspH n=1 Tax=Marinobacter caseinilyticus TaxID=2692195 RepID=UPI00140DE6C5|nr:type II secretion system minor pseudopilin GspH [Marinobacter caseinilyticus]
MPPRHPQSGFTLIEILVVLIVVGLLAALAIVNLGGGTQQRELENTVRELYLLMQTASEQAILNNQELGLILEEGSYRFVVFDDQQRVWAAQEERLFQSRSIPDWTIITPYIDNDIPRLASDDDALQPDLLFFSSGETTPFDIEFNVAKQPDTLHRLQSDGIASIEWLAPGEESDGPQ